MNEVPGLKVMLLSGALATAAALPSTAQEIDPEAAQILTAMSRYLTGLKTFSVEYDIDVEAVIETGQKLQFSSFGEVLVERPGKMKATRKGAVADAEMFLDGKTFTVHGRNLDAYYQADADSIDEAIGILRSDLNMDAPATDFLYSDAFDPELIDANSGTHVGMTSIGGVAVHHLAFRGDQRDWQIWVKDGETPLPIKYVITSKWVTAAPEYSIRFRNWNISPAIEASAFAFSPGGKTKADNLQADEFGDIVTGADQ